MSDFDEKDLLTQALRERSSDVGGHPINFDAVRRSAQKMQRRRQVVTGAVAAAVAGVALPTGLAVTSGLNTAEGPSENPSFAVPPSASPSPTAAATPDGPTVLSMDLPVGSGPELPYFLIGEYVLPDGRTLQLENNYTYVVPYDDGFLAQGYAGQGDQIFFLDQDGQVEGEPQDSGQGIVTSADGSHVGYVVIEEDGSQTLVNAPASGSDPVTWSFPAVPAVLPVGFADDDTLVYEAAAGGEVEGVYTARPGSETARVPHLLGGSSAAGGLVAGVTERRLGSICSGVVDLASGDLLWSDCAYATKEFSPDGEWLVAIPSDSDGLGPLSATVLDAGTGTPVVEYEQETRRGQVTLGDPEWESDRTLLSPITEGDEYGLVRLDLDGGLEHTIDTVRGEYGDWLVWLAR